MAARLLKVKKNQIAMVADRGYNVTEEAGLVTTDEATFIAYYGPYVAQNRATLRALLSRVYLRNDADTGNEERLLVYYAEPPGKKQIGSDEIKEFIGLMRSYGTESGVLIVDAPISSAGTAEFGKVPQYNIQVFNEDELMYNPTRHYLVPRHTALSTVEAREFLRANKLQANKLPLILGTGERIDPIAKWYGFAPGKIIRIDRENFIFQSLVEQETFFRKVI